MIFLKGITTRACKFMELDKEPTINELAQDLTMILEGHYQKENRFIPQAMVLVRTQKKMQPKLQHNSIKSLEM